MGKNAEAYVDDIVVKTREAHTLIADLEETFTNLRKVNIKLNPTKCAFGVPLGNLVGFLISHRGIEANPDKIKAIEEMRPPRRLKDMQRLAGCRAALRRFISRLGKRALPFFKIMKRSNTFEWTPEAVVAFEDVKRHLTSPLIMVAPRTREPLLLYLAATLQTSSAVLMAEREEPSSTKDKTTSPSPEHLDEGAAPSTPAKVTQQANLAVEVSLAEGGNLTEPPEKEGLVQPPARPHEKPTLAPKAMSLVQHPVYFISTVLRDTRERYTMHQKLLYTLLITSRKLRHYFQGHPIKVVTTYPLEQVLHNPNTTGHVAEWAIELQPFELTFNTTSTIKSRALADFTVEWTDPLAGEAHEEESKLPGKAAPGHWAMNFDARSLARALGLARCSLPHLATSSTMPCTSASIPRKRSPTTLSNTRASSPGSRPQSLSGSRASSSRAIPSSSSTSPTRATSLRMNTSRPT
ncbi:hypothetical protein ACQ4PT_000500 [Festuca glaucescens]